MARRKIDCIAGLFEGCHGTASGSKRPFAAPTFRTLSGREDNPTISTGRRYDRLAFKAVTGLSLQGYALPEIARQPGLHYTTISEVVGAEQRARNWQGKT